MTAFLIYIMKVAVLSAVFIVIYHLLLRHDTFHRVNRIILVSSLVLSYILPFVVITVHKDGAPVRRTGIVNERPVQEQAALPYQPVITSGSVYSSAPMDETAQADHRQNLTQVIEVTARDYNPEPAVAPRKTIRIDWLKVLAGVYLLGLLIVLVYRILSTTKVIRIIRKACVVEKNRDFTLVETRQSVHPFSWMRYIVLPQDGKAAGQAPILDHEKAHLAHHHSQELLWTDILSALQWFNPAMLLFRRDLYSIHEFQADSDVLQKGVDRRQYQYLMLDCATDKTEFRAANTFRKSTLEGRIDMINKKKSARTSLLKLAYIPVLLLFAMNVFAERVYDNELSEVLEVDNYVRIDGLWYKFKGNQVRVVSRKTRHEYPSDIVIPDTIIYKNVKYPVTSIGPRAFQYDENIKSVTIPSTVREIEEGSFYNCTGLERIIIPSSVRSIGESAFTGCSNLRSISIPASVRQIGYAAFAGTGLESITVQEGNPYYDSRLNCNAIIETVSNTLLYGSSKTVIPPTVTAIGESAFAGNTRLKTIGIPASVTTIGNRAFAECSSLQSIVIPGTVQKLEYGCFQHTGIKSLTINGSIELLSYAFTECDSLETVIYGPGATSVDIPHRCPNLRHLFIPATVTQIQNYQNSYQLNLESIIVENGNPVYDSREGCNAIIETATDRLILGCSNTVIPNTVRSISDYAFTGGHLKELYIPASVRDISPKLFQGTFDALSVNAPNYIRDLNSIVVDPANPVYDSREGCNAIIWKGTNLLLIACKSTTIPKSVRSIAENAFLKQDGLTELTIPDGVTTIMTGAFSYCTNLEKITIGEGLKEFSPNAFMGCPNISEIKVSPSNRTYDSRYDCNAVIETATGKLVMGSANTVIPDGVTTIGQNAFMSNQKITSIKLPPSVKTIEDYAFYNCTNLEEINLDNIIRKGDRALDGTASVRFTYADSINGFMHFQLRGKEAILYHVWDNAPAKVTIPQSFDYNGKTYTVTEIADDAFLSNTSIESVSVPGTVRTIGEAAFSECSGLKRVILHNGLTAIQDNAFAYCSSLESIELPATLEHIGRAAFTRSGLKSLDIPASVTSLGRNITLDCRNLKSIKVNSANKVFDSRKNCNAIIKTDINLLLEGCRSTRIPKDIVAIGPYAFAGASGLKRIDIPSSVQYIFDRAFAFCPLQKIEIPASVSLMYDNPFFGCGSIRSITVKSGNPTYSSPSGCNAIISNGNDIRVIRYPEVKVILDYIKEGQYMSRRPGTLIQGCRNTVIPASCTIIGNQSFAYCEGLERIDIPEGVVTVEHGAFEHCPDLKELHLAATVTDFNKSDYCLELSIITVDRANPVYDSREGCNAIIETEHDNLILGCRNTVIPSTVKYIDGNAFAHVRGLKSIVIPDSVERLGYQSFRDCSDLESVFISSSVRYLSSSYWAEDRDESNVIPQQPFYYCPKLTRITVDSENPYFDSRDNCNAIIETSTRNLRVGCSGTIEPESMSSVRPDAYQTLENDIYETDYLSTSWIFPDGRMVHTYYAGDDDD